MQTPHHPETNMYPSYNPQSTSVMTTGDWFSTQLILAIPIVNIIMLLVWASSSSGNLNRRNFCRATLLWAIVVGVIYGFIILLVVAAGNNY